MHHNEKKYRFRCVVCGRWYLSARPESQYCEFNCRRNAWRKRKKEGEQRVLKDLAEEFKKVREEQETLAKMKKENDAKLKTLEEEIIMEMINTGQTSTKFENVGRITVKKGYAGKIANKETFFQYLRDSGQAHLIDEQVHWQRLQSWMNDIGQEELPKAHEAGLDYYEKTILSFTKA